MIKRYNNAHTHVHFEKKYHKIVHKTFLRKTESRHTKMCIRYLRTAKIQTSQSIHAVELRLSFYAWRFLRVQACCICSKSPSAGWSELKIVAYALNTIFSCHGSLLFKVINKLIHYQYLSGSCQCLWRAQLAVDVRDVCLDFPATERCPWQGHGSRPTLHRNHHQAFRCYERLHFTWNFQNHRLANFHSARQGLFCKSAVSADVNFSHCDDACPDGLKKTC